MSDALADGASTRKPDSATGERSDPDQAGQVAPKQDRPLVYIAGPYTRDDPVLNTRAAVEWAEAIELRECDVSIPHLSLLWHAISPAPIEKWYARDLAVLARCDALVRFPGPSTGADAEVAFAEARDIPCFVVGDDRDAFWAAFTSWRYA